MAGNKPIKFDFIADVSKYLREVKGMEVATEDLEDAFVGVTHNADEMERKLSRAMKDAASDTEVLERAIKDIPKATDSMADSADKDFDKLADSADDAGGKVRRTMADTGAEAGAEFKSNLAETLASGGSPQELILGTLAGVIPALGPIMAGAAAALAGIAGLAFRHIQEEKERIEEMLSSLRDGLQAFYTQGIQTATAQERLQFYSDWIADNLENIGLIEDATLDVGVATDDVVAAALGGNDAYSAMITKLYEVVEQERLAGGALSVRGQHAQDVANWMDQIRGTTSEERTDQERIAAYTQATAAAMGLIDTNADGVIDDTDKLVADLTEAERRALGVNTAITTLPEFKRIQLDFYTTGQGADFANRNSVNYSPGHEGIRNMYVYNSRNGRSG